MPRQRPIRTAAGVIPRLSDALLYERALNRIIAAPMIDEVETAVRGAGKSYESIRQAIRAIPQDPRIRGLSSQAAASYMAGLKAYHIDRFNKSMRRWLGVRVRFMGDAVYGPIMQQAIVDNVSLIVTIPQRLHTGLIKDLSDLARDAPFDQAQVRSMLAKNYQSSGYNLRRLTRDQTSKTIGRFTEARQEQAGIEEYVWVTSKDDRVRLSHRDNDGKTFAWKVPPPITGHPGHDIQCRCFAKPVIPKRGETARQRRTAPGPDRFREARAAGVVPNEMRELRKWEDLQGMLGEVNASEAIKEAVQKYASRSSPNYLPFGAYKYGGEAKRVWAYLHPRLLQLKAKAARPVPPPPRPKPTKAQPTPKPVSTGTGPDNAEKWASVNKLKRRKAAEQEWHEASWDHVDSAGARAAGEAQGLGAVENVGTRGEYSPGYATLNMNGRDIATRRGRRTWRHEYGHHIDAKAGSGPKLASGLQRTQKQISAAIEKSLKTAPRHMEALATDARGFARLGAADRRRRLDALADKVGISREHIRQFLSSDGYLATRGRGLAVDQMGDAAHDAIEYYLLTALEQGHIRAVSNVLHWEDRLFDDLIRHVTKIDKAGHDQVRKALLVDTDLRALQAVSDLIDALSDSRIKTFYGHGKAEYVGPRGRVTRGTEVFANSVDIDGAGADAIALYKAMFPELYADIQKTLEGYIANRARQRGDR